MPSPRRPSRALARGAAAALFAAAPTSQSATAPGPPHAQATYCPATTAASHPEELWEATNFDSGHATQLMELKWLPEAQAGQDLGRIACLFAPPISRYPYPQLLSRFLVSKPITPGWMRPSPNVDWLLCSGATMTRFDPSQCPFEPAHALPTKEDGVSPFGAR